MYFLFESHFWYVCNVQVYLLKIVLVLKSLSWLTSKLSDLQGNTYNHSWGMLPWLVGIRIFIWGHPHIPGWCYYTVISWLRLPFNSCSLAGSWLYHLLWSLSTGESQSPVAARVISLPCVLFNIDAGVFYHGMVFDIFLDMNITIVWYFVLVILHIIKHVSACESFARF